MEEAGDEEGRSWAKALRFSAVGLEMGISVALCIWLGSWIDDKLGTKPYFGVGLLLLGVGAAFYALIRAARQAQREQMRDEKRDGKE